MRYHYEKPTIYAGMFARPYAVPNNPIYDRCTLYKIGDKGLGVIQQRYIPDLKATIWTDIDRYLIDDIYLNPRFKEYFNERARTCTDGEYPTVTVRQIMWALKMKPLPKERWETTFDRRFA